MHLLYITFGPNERNHVQAYFSISSFLARHAEISSINIITDQPLFYKNIEKHLNIIPVNEQKLTDWKGKHSFFWRIKIKGIELICRQHPNEAVLYLDTDTILYNDFSKCMDLVKSNRAGMHENEGKLSDFGTKTTAQFNSDIRNIKFETLSPVNSYDMWNAGAVLTPNTKNCEEVELILRLCDRMLDEKAKQVLIEQYSLSVGLEHMYGLSPLSPFIAHYWSNKDEWNELISRFFIGTKLQDLDEEEMLEKFRAIDFSKVAAKRIKRNTNTRLKRLVDKYYADKYVEYLDIK